MQHVTLLKNFNTLNENSPLTSALPLQRWLQFTGMNALNLIVVF
jgi:hypothetical protein